MTPGVVLAGMQKEMSKSSESSAKRKHFVVGLLWSAKAPKFANSLIKTSLKLSSALKLILTVMEDLWRKMLDRNEADVREPQGIIAR